ncbi:MAG: GNAT family N-acetyltransferase [Armatimonadetes bacterium]|nr:GNAT family N-acetyltransferase [Armatimonadota bacterium]
MEIVPFEPKMAEAVARCYNELIEPVPHCYPVTKKHFSSVKALDHWRLRDEEIAVAREGREIVGFVDVAKATPTKQWELPPGEPGVIRFLAYRVGERAIGQALLEWAEDQLRGQGETDVIGWHGGLRYRFYHFGWAHLSERIGHVRGLFGMNAYREFDSELFLTWCDYDPPVSARPNLDFDLKIDWSEGSIGRRLAVSAMQGEDRLGRCTMDWGQHSPSPESKLWCYCDGLGVEDRAQGKRLGMYLLTYALAEMKEVGCRHAAISTNGTNYRAQLMYTNMGYQVTDFTVAFRKDLSKR